MRLDERNGEEAPLLRAPPTRSTGIQGGEEAEAPVLVPLLLTLVVALGPVSFGYALGFTSPLRHPPACPSSALIADAGQLDGPLYTQLARLSCNRSESASETCPAICSCIEHDTHMSPAEYTWFVSLLNIGALAGALVAGPLSDGIGRRDTIAMGACLFIVGHAIVSVSHSFAEALAGRLLTGLGTGAVSLAVPVYIAEIAPPRVRGALGASNQWFINFGILIAYICGLFLAWRELARVGIALGALLLVLLVAVPRTPRWLYSRGRHEEARLSLVRIRGRAYDVDSELREMMKTQLTSAAGDTGSAWHELASASTMKAVGVGVSLMIFQQWSGINGVVASAGSILSEAGVQNPNLGALYIGIVQIVFTFIGCILVDRAGRKNLLMTGMMGAGLSCALMGFYDSFCLAQSAIAVAALLLYIAFIGIGVGAVPWLMMSEIFPMRVRGLASSIVSASNWILSFSVIYAFPTMTESLSPAGTFWLFAAVLAVGTVFVGAVVPETKGRTLEEIESYFKGANLRVSVMSAA